MTNTYYISLSGMMAASYGLRNTSNNVANMQSAGYKRTDVFYSSLGNSHGHGLGSGVYVAGERINFAAGNYQETSSPSDLAVVGNGFFIVKLKNGELLYTRNGQFGFNNDGLLIDKHSGGLVQGYDKQKNLSPISQFGSKINPGKATHYVDLKGEFIIAELAEPDKFGTRYERNRFSVTLYDEKGRKLEVALEFEAPHTPTNDDKPSPFHDELTWELVDAKCNGDNQSIQFNPQKIQFKNDSGDAAEEGSNTIQFTLNNTQTVTLNFGVFTDDVASSVRLYKKDKTTQSHLETSIDALKQDGYGFGKQTDFSFDDNGQIRYQYNNGQSESGIHVALAMFDDLENTLIPAHDNLFRAKHTQGLRIGRANKELFGSIQPKQLESSNVDSTTEFANIVVLQRMFQACSQIMDIDKQLLEELYKK